MFPSKIVRREFAGYCQSLQRVEDSVVEVENRSNGLRDHLSETEAAIVVALATTRAEVGTFRQREVTVAAMLRWQFVFHAGQFAAKIGQSREKSASFRRNQRSNLSA